ncbi:hypothetical protein [Streptomyces sp. SID14515]|uniref:hypothetical protein n=1 Tax=Streptomyces sp. SID14515 TaxID=2706074 RepID=UPI0013CD85FA|nr:hypothetical protein [Streptomyces sp. SID14515]NEB42548.1 hypothetical protein [Streptomyces sp. SID14515]
MAEISYPFNADNATTGATKAVSEVQWQNMAHLWGGDRIDRSLSGQASAAALPFSGKVVNVSTVQIGPGKAWVGGFYYELTSALNLTVAANTANTPRKDLVVIRADMSKPSVNLAVRKGTNAATPLEPAPVRQAGGVWEMPLYEISLPANGGLPVLASRGPYNIPDPVAFPWNTAPSAALMPKNTFAYDMDSNGPEEIAEYFNYSDKPRITRQLGPTRKYTPNLVNATALQQGLAVREGRYRWIGPSTVWFSMRIFARTIDIKHSEASWYLGVSLPVAASAAVGQTFHGIVQNTGPRGPASGMPNYFQLTGWTPLGKATTTLILLYPNHKNLAAGLDGLPMLPGGSSLVISGVYEAADFPQ